MSAEPSTPDPLGLSHLGKLSDAAASVCNNIVSQMSKGIGVVYDDLVVVLRARRQAEAKLLQAAADDEVEANRRRSSAQTDREIAIATALHEEQLEQRARRRLISDAKRQQDNIEAIIFAAIEHVVEQAQEGGPHRAPPTSQPTADWITEFTEMCRNASDSNMRQLWARVLAGETQQPGSFSIRSLLALKTLLLSEAQEFRLAANLVLNGEWIYRGEDNNATAGFGVTFSSFLSLAAAGLLAPNSSTAIEIGGKERTDQALITYEPYLILFERIGTTPLPMNVPIWKLTAVGQELVSLIQVEHNWDYVRSFISVVSEVGWLLNIILTPEGFPPPPADLPTQHTKRDQDSGSVTQP